MQMGDLHAGVAESDAGKTWLVAHVQIVQPRYLVLLVD